MCCGDDECVLPDESALERHDDGRPDEDADDHEDTCEDDCTDEFGGGHGGGEWDIDNLVTILYNADIMTMTMHAVSVASTRRDSCARNLISTSRTTKHRLLS